MYLSTLTALLARGSGSNYKKIVSNEQNSEWKHSVLILSDFFFAQDLYIIVLARPSEYITNMYLPRLFSQK